MTWFPRSRRARIVVVAIAATASTATVASAQSGGGGGQDEDVRPAPPSIGADVPLSYFGPSPSEVQDELVGPLELLRSGEIDEDAGTITMPLYEGRESDGTPVWYILTDTSDPANAEALGLNFSAKLNYATGATVRSADLESGTLVFTTEQAGVDFAPQRSLTPGSPTPFPPASAEPGSVGQARYSPLVRLTNAGGFVYNAPVVAYGSSAEEISACDGDPNPDLVHDKVVSICPEQGTVTMRLTTGFSFAKPVLYLSTDASDPVAATLEEATLAPGMATFAVGGDDGAFSAVERIFLFTNGPTGAENPQRQGLDSAIADGRGPLNVLGGIPTVATDYSPIWDANIGEWTQEAVDQGFRSRLIDEFQILGLVEQGWITGPGGAPYGSTGITINCPIVFRFL